MLDVNAKIDMSEVVRIKDQLIKEGVVSASDFELKQDFDIASGATHYPIMFIVDVSGSMHGERENLNAAIHDFIGDIWNSKTALSSSIDFSIVTFANRVIVKRPFSYIKAEDFSDDAERNTIKAKDVGGSTNMASALFVAWYLSEVRKGQYKRADLDYKQPIFVLISDLCNNEERKIDDSYHLVSEVLSMYRSKVDGKRIGMIKALYGNISDYYDEKITGIRMDGTVDFSKTLKTLFSDLLSTVARMEDKGKYFKWDAEDDDVFLPDNQSDYQQPGDNSFTSETYEKLKALFDCDDNEE